MTDDALAAAAEAAAAREARLSQLEQAVKNFRPKTKDDWEKLQAISPLISGLLVVIVGYFLTGSVNNAIQRQQLQLSNVREMRELLGQLDTAQAESAAFTLSAFGRPAVPALIAALAAGGDVRAPAAEQALRAIGLADPGAVCDPARTLLDNRSGTFSWLAHLSAIRLLGDMECRGARASLEAYAQAVRRAQERSDPSELAARYTPEPSLDAFGMEQLKAALERTLRILSP